MVFWEYVWRGFFLSGARMTESLIHMQSLCAGFSQYSAKDSFVFNNEVSVAVSLFLIVYLNLHILIDI